MPYNFLIADDSKSMRKVLRKSIEMCNIGEIVFYEAENGREALEILPTTWVDIIFTDINMPIMDGYELIENIRKNEVFKNTPIVAVTSESREDKLKDIVNKGADTVLTKPFYPEQLRQQIFNILGLEEQDEENWNFEGSDF